MAYLKERALHAAEVPYKGVLDLYVEGLGKVRLKMKSIDAGYLAHELWKLLDFERKDLEWSDAKMRRGQP